MSESKLVSKFREEVRRHVGVVAEELVPDGEPTFTELRQLYPTGPDLARALGLGEARDHRKGSRAWRRRRNLLDDYARWRRGSRNPWRGKRAPELKALVRAQWRLDATPESEIEVLRSIRDSGITVTLFRGRFHYDSKRERSISAKVYVSPAVLAEAGFPESIAEAPPIDWDWSARATLNAWARAYGLDDDFQGKVDEEGAVLEDLRFELGRLEEVDYSYGS